MRTTFFLSLICTLLSTTVKSQVIHVPTEQPTIQDGLNAASFGDTVLVAPGTYFENITWPNVNGIKLIAGGDTSDTFIDGSTTERVIHIQGHTIDTLTVIEGFTIQNGDANTTICGSGVFCDTAGIVISKCRVRNNIGGIGAGLAFVRSSSKVTDCSIEGNYARAIEAGGVGLFIYDSSFVQILSSEIHHNLADSCVDINGVGFYVSKHSFANISDTKISYNTGIAGYSYGEFRGVGVFSNFSSSLKIVNSYISNNKGIGLSKTRAGVAVNVNGGKETLFRNVLITENQAAPATDWSSGVVTTYSNLSEFNDVQIINNTVKCQNSQFDNLGILDALGDFSGENIILKGNILNLIDSETSIESALFDYKASYSRKNLRLTNCLFSDNESSNTQVGSTINALLRIRGAANAAIVNSTLANNFFGLDRNIVSASIDADTTNLSVVNSVLWNPNVQSEIEGTNVTVEYSNVRGGFTGTGNINADPMFIGNGDYRLQTFSPCINSGTLVGTPLTDIEGNPRPMPIGTNPDMGAYEDGNPSTSILENADSENLSIYPNPTNGFVQISLKEKVENIQVFSTIGKLVTEFTKNQKNIDLSGLPNGIYSLMIMSEKRKFTEKLVLHK